MSRLLKVTAMSGLLTLLKMTMGFVIAKVVAIYTGPTGMAMLGQVQSMVTSVNGVINAPAGNGVVRYTAENINSGFESCAPWWRATIQWIFILLVIAVPIGIFFADHIAYWLFNDYSLSWVVVAAFCFLPLSAIGTLFNSVINGQQQYRRYIALGFISVSISSLFMLVMIYVADMKGALLAASLQSALIGMIMLVANLRQPWFKFRYWWGVTCEHRAIGGYMLMAIISALAMPMSLIAVRNFLISDAGWDAAGQWQAVWKISEVYLGVITMALSTYYLPRLSSLTNADEIHNEIRSTVRVVFPAVVLMAIFIYVSKDLIINLIFTDEFFDARKFFAAQLCGDVVKILSWLYAFPMISKGRVKWFISTEVFFSMTFVGLSYVFIDRVGAQGASISYLINYVIYFSFIRLNISGILNDK